MPRSFWLETLGCPKNQVDSDKLVGTLLADGLVPATSAGAADLIVVNTCAFVEEARQESVDTILALDDARRAGAELVVTGCLAERAGAELAEAMPEIDRIAPFNAALLGATEVPVALGRRPPAPAFDLLNLPRPAPRAPWAYLKVAEGCDRACGFCAIPSFRGPQRSRRFDDIVAEAAGLAAAGVREIVLVAQDLAAYGRDRTAPAVPLGLPEGSGASRPLVDLLRRVGVDVPWVRLLYLYPSDLTDDLIDEVASGDVPYFDLSLQHVSAPLLRRMRRWGDGERFLRRIADIRARRPEATFRTNFIVGYPGETEDDHGLLLRFVEEADLDWCGFFAFSPEDGTYAVTLDGAVAPSLVADRLTELREVQDRITARRRDDLIGATVRALVDEPGVARTFREAPEIEGIVEVPGDLAVGEFVDLEIVDAAGPDLVGRPR